MVTLNQNAEGAHQIIAQGGNGSKLVMTPKPEVVALLKEQGAQVIPHGAAVAAPAAQVAPRGAALAFGQVHSSNLVAVGDMPKGIVKATEANFGRIATDMTPKPKPFATISSSHVAGTAVMPSLNGGTAPAKPQGWMSKVGSAIKTNPGKAVGIAAAVGAVTWVAHEMGKRAGANEAEKQR